MELENFQGVITKYNVDSNGSSISVTRTEEQQIHPLKFNITTGIIDELEGFTVLNKQMYPVRNYEDLQNANQYWVDYAGGRVYFHSSLKGTAIRYRYGDKGYNLISANRVFTKLDENGSVVELLSDLIDQTREYIAILGTFEQATIVIKKLEQNITKAETLHNNLSNDIEVGTPLQVNLHADIAEATKWKDQLHSDVVDGKVLSPTLQNDVIEANVAKEELEEALTHIQDDIAVINSTGNETVTVLATEWTYNNESKMYEKTITHNCASENIHITCKTSNTKEALFLPWRIVDKSKILLKSDEKIGAVINISARYYKPLNLESVDEGEIIEGRGKYNSLNDRMNTFVSFENFTGNTIN